MDIYFNYTKFCGSLLKLARGFDVYLETFYHPTCRTIKVKLSIIRVSTKSSYNVILQQKIILLNMVYMTA